MMGSRFIHGRSLLWSKERILGERLKGTIATNGAKGIATRNKRYKGLLALLRTELIC